MVDIISRNIEACPVGPLQQGAETSIPGSVPKPTRGPTADVAIRAAIRRSSTYTRLSTARPINPEPMSKLNLLNIFVALLLAVSGSTASAESGPSAQAWMEIDANGQIVELQWDSRSMELSEAVRKAIEARLRAMPWKPSAELPYASRFGTTVEVDTLLEEDGDAQVLRVSQLRAGVSYLKLKPPIYPSSALRRKQQADLLAIVTVGEDGRARFYKILRSPESPEDFEKELSDAIQFWRFKNETLDGSPVRGVINVPVRFSMHCQRGDKGFELEAPKPGSVMQVDSGTANANLIEVTASQRFGKVKQCDE